MSRMTPAQTGVYNLLSDGDENTAAELAGELDRFPTNVSRDLQALMNHGLVTARHDGKRLHYRRTVSP